MSVRGLLREFDDLSRLGTPRVRAWAARHPVLAECAGLREVLAAVRADPDPVLYALLSETRAGCRVAPQVVLQSLLPKMIVMAGRDRGGVLDEYLGQLWLRIIDHPLERRPRRIAANLVLDTLKAVQAERGQRLVLLDNPDEVHCLPGVLSRPEPRPDTRGLLRTAMNRGLVDPHTHAVLVSIYADGLTRDDAAEHYRVTPTTIQRRCQRGIKALAAHADELVDAL